MKPSFLLIVCLWTARCTQGANSSDAHDMVNRKTNLCDRQRAVMNGSVPLQNGLVGAHLTLGTGFWSDMYLQKNAETGELYGLEMAMLTELSKRASFTYDIIELKFGDWCGSWSDCLMVNMKVFDMLTYAYFTITPSRTRKGAFSPYGFFDASTVLITFQVEAETTFMDGFFQFAKPFNENVWLCIVGVVVATGFLFWFLEGDRNEEDFGPQDPCCHPGKAAQAVTKTILQLTGGGGFSPATWPGKILLMSWSWCVVLLLSAYTANLASFLVAKAEKPPDFTSLQQAVRKEKTICTTSSGWRLAWMKEAFPGYDKIHEEKRNMDMANALFSGKCDAMLMGMDEFNELAFTPQLKRRCELYVVGLPLNKKEAGWMVENDHTKDCTVLLRDVLTYHFVAMEDEGIIESMKDKRLKQMASECPKAEEEEPADTTQLDMLSMGGIVGMHFIGMLVSCLFFASNKYYQKRKSSQYSKSSNTDTAKEVTVSM